MDSLIGHVGEEVVGAVGWRHIQHGYLLNTQDLLVPALREVTMVMSLRLEMCMVLDGIISKANKFYVKISIPIGKSSFFVCFFNAVANSLKCTYPEASFFLYSHLL